MGSPVTIERVLAAVKADDNLGFCLDCGEEAFGVEPDAKNYKCQACGKKRVFGAEELLMRFGFGGG